MKITYEISPATKIEIDSSPKLIKIEKLNGVGISYKLELTYSEADFLREFLNRHSGEIGPEFY